MKTTSFRHNYALAAFAWCLLASMCCAQIIGSGVLGGGDIALKLDPAAAYDADNGTWADAAIQFNASDNSWLQMATNYDPGTNDFVLNAWVYLDSRTSYRTILCTGATSNGQDGIFWAVHSSGDVYFKLNDSTTGTAAYKLWSVALNTGTWYNLAVHVDRDGVASLYVDGVAEVDTLDVSDHQDSLGATGGVIGADLTGGNPYDGRIDSLFICQAADLSSVASDIVSWAYNAGEGRIYDDMTASQKTDWGLVSFCDFNGPVGGGWVDSHGTNHLTPQFADVIAPATFGSELLANGDLNDWTGGVCDGWAENSLGTGSVDEEPTIVHTSGGSSTKITTGDLSAINQRQVNIAVEASTSYRFAYWTRGDGTYDGSHRVYDETNAANIVDITSNGVTGTEWQLVTVDFTTPATCNTIFISLGGNGAVGAATYFDDVSLKQYTPGTLNGGLEEWTDVTRTQLVSNSGFDSAATDWTAENSASLASVAGGVEGNALEITNGGATAGRAYQSLTVTPGATYRLTLWHKNGTAQGGIWVGNGVANTAYFDITGLNDASWTQYEYHFVAVTTVLDIRARCYSTTAGHITLFDAIELIQIASNADDWTESTSGSSIIRRGDEPDHVDDGTHSLVMEVDIANSNASIRLEDVLTAAKRYSYTIRAKADSGTPSIYIGGLATGNRSVATLDTTWTEYTGTFATIDAKLYVGRNSAVAKTIYLDGFYSPGRRDPPCWRNRTGQGGSRRTGELLGRPGRLAACGKQHVQPAADA